MSSPLFSRTELEVVSAPTPRLPQCGKCGLFKTCKSPKMPVAGRGKRGIFVIGEAPGETEDEKNRPFVGQSGETLQSAVTRAGGDLFRDCWVGNSISCRPPGNKLANYPRAVEYCRPLVLRAIEELKPRVIILVGGAAVKSVLGHLWKSDPGGISRWTGYRIPLVRWDCWVCPVVHPSYLNRTKDPVEAMGFDGGIRAAFKLKGRPYNGKPPDYDSMVTAVPSPEEAGEFLEMIQDKRPKALSFDFETTTLKPDGPHAEIVCCSVSDGRHSIAFPWLGRAAKRMTQLLAEPKIEKHGWNCLSGDTKYLTREHGIVSLRETVGQRVSVLNHHGKWVPATIKKFGRQRTTELSFVRRNVKVTVRATDDHRWLTPAGSELRSEQLKRKRYNRGSGTADSVPFRTAHTRVVDAGQWEAGVRHGVIYGDGWKAKNKDNFYQIRLCGEKKELLGFFHGFRVSYAPSHNGDPTVYVTKQTAKLKELPDRGVSDCYLIGFFQGLLATDGCVNHSGQISVTGTGKLIRWCVKNLPRVGFWFQCISDMSKYGNSGYGSNKNFYTAYLNRESVTMGDLLRTKHQKNYKQVNMGPYKFHGRGKTRTEDVYCAVVPDGESFTLDGGLVTGNCKFEERWCRRVLGVRVRGWAWDGMLAAHLLDTRSGQTSLKFQAFANLGVEDWSRRVKSYLEGRGGNGPNKVKRFPLRDLLTYCAKDSLFEFMMAKKQAKQLGCEL